MSKEEEGVEVVEHVVFFKAREGVLGVDLQSAKQRLRALGDLHGILQFHAGLALPASSSSLDSGGSGGWAFALHGRYSSREALAAYSSHPRHLDVVRLGEPLVQDTLAVDWLARLPQPGVNQRRVAAVRAVTLKFKENSPLPEISSLTLALGTLAPGVTSFTSGPNITLARGKGFNWGFVALFGTIKEMEEVQKSGLHEELLRNAIVEKFLVVDFAVEDEPDSADPC